MADEKKTTEPTATTAATVDATTAQDVAVTDTANDATDNPNIVTVKLSKPFRGKDELVLNFDDVTGATLIRCEKNAKTIDNTLFVVSGSLIFNAQVAAAAAKVRYDDIIGLPLKDFAAVSRRVGNFINGAE